MISSMVTINDDYMTSKPRPVHPGLEGKNETHASNILELHSSNTSHMQPPKSSIVPSTSTTDKLPGLNGVPAGKEKISNYHDMPLLISDHDGEDSEGESVNGNKTCSADERESVNPAFTATQEVKRSIKQEKTKEDRPEDAQTSTALVETINEGSLVETKQQDTTHVSLSANIPSAGPESEVNLLALTQDAINCERSQVMKIVVKYVAMKITNSFPPQSSRTADPKEMPLDEYLMILVSRLQLSLPLFMKGIIYLFRYMDIIYLLRYVNQSNNFANYTDMGYGLKKLIIGCYRLVLARERKTKDWSTITGLSNAQINDIVKTVVGRLNGKLLIKSAELIRLRSEIFRFVTMVTKTV